MTREGSGVGMTGEKGVIPRSTATRDLLGAYSSQTSVFVTDELRWDVAVHRGPQPNGMRPGKRLQASP